MPPTAALCVQLRDLLAAGQRLPLGMGQLLDELAHHIQQREWEDGARRTVAAHHNSLQALREALEAAEASHVEGSALARNLRRDELGACLPSRIQARPRSRRSGSHARRAKVHAAEEWDRRAAEFLEHAVGPQVAEALRPTLQELSLLVQDGDDTGNAHAGHACRQASRRQLGRATRVPTPRLWLLAAQA